MGENGCVWTSQHKNVLDMTEKCFVHYLLMLVNDFLKIKSTQIKDEK